MSVDWTGKRFSGAEVVSSAARGWGWSIRCACGTVFVAPSHRLRLAQAYVDGRRKAPAHVRCEHCTARSRAAAVRRRGGFQGLRRAS